MNFDQTEIQVQVVCTMENKHEKKKSTKKNRNRATKSKGDSSSSSTSTTSRGRKKDASKRKKKSSKKEIKKSSKASSRIHVALEKEDDGTIFLITFKNQKQKEDFLEEEKATVLLEIKKRKTRKSKSKNTDRNDESLTGWETYIVHDDDDYETYNTFQHHGQIRNDDSQSSMLTDSTASLTSRGGLFDSSRNSLINDDSFGSLSSFVPTINQSNDSSALEKPSTEDDIEDEESIYASLGGSVSSSSAPATSTSDTDNLDESLHFEDLLCMEQVDEESEAKKNHNVRSCSMSTGRIDQLIEKFEQSGGGEEWIHPLYRDDILHQKHKRAVVTKKEEIQKNIDFDALLKKFEPNTTTVLRAKKKYDDDEEEEEWIHPLYRSMYF